MPDDAQLDHIVGACADALGRDVTGAIVHGSWTSDDFQPGRSDLDLLLVVESELDAHRTDALVEVVRAADPRPAAGIDLLVVTRRTAGSPGDHPARELAVGRWPGGDGLEIDGRDDHVPDVWAELSEARQHGRSLFGPTPHDVLGPVPAHLLHDVNESWLHTWLTRTDDAANATHMVLTACRMWCFAATGRHESKSAAARWILARRPDLAAVHRALAVRTTGEQRAIPADEIEQVLQAALAAHG